MPRRCRPPGSSRKAREVLTKLSGTDGRHRARSQSRGDPESGEALAIISSYVPFRWRRLGPRRGRGHAGHGRAAGAPGAGRCRPAERQGPACRPRDRARPDREAHPRPPHFPTPPFWLKTATAYGGAETRASRCSAPSAGALMPCQASRAAPRSRRGGRRRPRSRRRGPRAADAGW